MAEGRRYAVLDKNGKVINHILISDPLPAKYWPGYGAALVPLEDCDCSAGAGLDVHILKITDIPQIGDTLNVETGELTKFVPELVQDFDHEKGEPRVDDKGEPVMVVSAPEVKFTRDADPKTVKFIIDRADVEVKDGSIKGGK